MPLNAKYLFIVSMDMEAEYEDLFNEVYDTEHVPNICNVPGVNAAYRLKLEEGVPLSKGAQAGGKATEQPQRYMAIYELDSPDLPGSDAWREEAEKGRWPSRPNLQPSPRTPLNRETVFNTMAASRVLCAR